MRRVLSKEESRVRYGEGRALWNEFDPIGVFQIDEDWPKDEYDSYIGPTLRLVIDGRAVTEIESYVRSVVHEHMGLSETEQGNEAIREFARKFSEWYQKHWAGTELESQESKEN